MDAVYVLTSGPEDYYTEQAVASMHSLRSHNPGMNIILVTDKYTMDSFHGDRETIKHYVNEFKTVDLPENLNPKQRSRFLKTSLRRLLKGDFLYIDCDTIICDKIDGLDEFKGDIGAVRDCHKPSTGNVQLKKALKATGKKVSVGNDYFQGGVLLVRDTPWSSKFFKDWHEIWKNDNEKYNLQIDQFAFAQSNVLNPGVVCHLPDEYNCQLIAEECWRHIFKVKIFHYISDLPEEDSFPLKLQPYLKIIRKNGINKEIQEILDNPIKEILKRSLVIGRKDLEIYRSPASVFANKLSRDFPVSNKIVSLIYKIYCFPKKWRK